MQYFRYDYKTLHSCILVNRLWCRLAIPLLWEDPFKYKVSENCHFIEIILRNLNDDDKTKLNEYVIIDNDSFHSNTLFNYPSFIQHLITYRIFHSVEKWVTSITTKKRSPSSYFIQKENLSNYRISNFEKLIYRSLFLIFTENEMNLHSFDITLKDNEIKIFDKIFELILQKPNFIYNIKNLKFCVNRTTENMTKFLELVHFNCKSISSLYFRFLPLYISDYNSIIEKGLSRIINSQENLRKISFVNSSYSLYDPLSSLKHPNCSNTLNTIIFYMVDFENITVLNEVFNQLNVLESIHIVHCCHLDSKFIQQINNIHKPFKLKSLFLKYCNLQIESLKYLIQISGNYLENIGIKSSGSNELQQILPSIIKYCSKIKFLGPIRLDNQNIYLLFDLIKNIAQNLNYLTINLKDSYNGYDKGHFSSIILRNLGQNLPFKLEYLNLRLVFNTSDLELFLRNSQNTFIKKLLIFNYIENNNRESIFPYIKEYIMKRKRVKYLAIIERFNEKNEDLFSLKDKVKEFQLYDIQILNYYHLIIYNHDYVVEETY
ncbi:hypothetical protein RclHR1_03070015 [Rhizophagus clarus]|nr:hypothetical protein RclHR1_03070015 [Rhizophagus clarus]